MPVQRRRPRRLPRHGRARAQRATPPIQYSPTPRPFSGVWSLYFGPEWAGRAEAVVRDARSLSRSQDPPGFVLLASDRAGEPVWRRALARVGAAATCALDDVAPALCSIGEGRRYGHCLVLFDCTPGRGIEDFVDAAPLILGALARCRITALCSVPADELRPTEARLFERCVVVDRLGRLAAEVWNDED